MSRPRSFNRSWLLIPAATIPFSLGVAIAEPARCGLDPQCQSHLDRGLELDLVRKYELALREFHAAHKQQQDPRVALNIGRTLHKIGRFAEALTWYSIAGRAAPADTELQKQLQEFIAQAKQNLLASPAAPAPMTVVNQPTFAVQTSPANLTSTMESINNNNLKIELGALPRSASPVHKRVALWIPLAGLVLTAGAVGVAAAAWPRPWQPDPSIPSYPIFTAGAAAAGGVR